MYDYCRIDVFLFFPVDRKIEEEAGKVKKTIAYEWELMTKYMYIVNPCHAV